MDDSRIFPHRHKRPLEPPKAGMPANENIYENVPPRKFPQRDLGGRQAAPLPPVPPKKIPNGIHPPMAPSSMAMANGKPPSFSLNDQRLRGVSVDRHRDYQTPGYYEDTYITREETDRRITVKHVDHPPLANGRLERHASHPNLRPRPSTAGGRRLPKTPQQPPGTIIVIENVVGAGGGTGAATGTGRGRTLPDVRRAGSSAALDRNSRMRAPGAAANTGPAGVHDPERRSLSLPRRPTAKSTIKDILQSTGRRLPKTPHQSTLPLQHHPTGTGGGAANGPPNKGPPPSSGRKRELPKPQSLELRHSNREFMNSSNASLGLGGLVGRSSRSMNFPRLEGSPTHSECSSESGFLLSRPRYPGGGGGSVLRSNSVTRRKLPDV